MKCVSKKGQNYDFESNSEGNHTYRNDFKERPELKVSLCEPDLQNKDQWHS